MECYYRDAAVFCKNPNRRGNSLFNISKFVVHCYPKRLECPCRGMNGAPAQETRHRRFDDTYKVRGALNLFLIPFQHDRMGDVPCIALISVFAENSFKFG